MENLKRKVGEKWEEVEVGGTTGKPTNIADGKGGGGEKRKNSFLLLLKVRPPIRREKEINLQLSPSFRAREGGGNRWRRPSQGGDCFTQVTEYVLQGKTGIKEGEDFKNLREQKILSEPARGFGVGGKES